jgi:hypothetical protein
MHYQGRRRGGQGGWAPIRRELAVQQRGGAAAAVAILGTASGGQRKRSGPRFREGAGGPGRWGKCSVVRATVGRSARAWTAVGPAGRAHHPKCHSIRGRCRSRNGRQPKRKERACERSRAACGGHEHRRPGARFPQGRAPRAGRTKKRGHHARGEEGARSRAGACARDRGVPQGRFRCKKTRLCADQGLDCAEGPVGAGPVVLCG